MPHRRAGACDRTSSQRYSLDAGNGEADRRLHFERRDFGVYGAVFRGSFRRRKEMNMALVKVNGTAEPWQQKTISALLAGRGIDTASRGIAVACNSVVV